MDDDKDIMAHFWYKLPIDINLGGWVEKDPYQSAYPIGSGVVLTAYPDYGYMFAGWGGDISGMMNPTYITVMPDMVITATFVPTN